MVYRKDISENRPGLVEGEENEAKVVYRHENQYDPNCVRLYKLYMSLRPADHPADSLYLMPLQKPSATYMHLLAFQPATWIP